MAPLGSRSRAFPDRLQDIFANHKKSCCAVREEFALDSTRRLALASDQSTRPEHGVGKVKGEGMNPADLTSTLESLKIISQLELAMAEFYRACAEAWEAEKAFWLSLEQQELHHIHNLAKMANILTQRQARFERNRSFNVAAVQTFISYVKTTTQGVQSGQLAKPDSSRVLTIARDMEQSILESKYAEIVKTSDVEYQTIVRKILSDTAAHKKGIEAQITAKAKER